MEVEVTAEAKDKRLNQLVAVTVVVLSVCTGLGNIKDGNIVQAMQQAKADAVDTWSEYQANRIKLHVAEVGRAELANAVGSGRQSARNEIAALDAEIRKYRDSTPGLAAKAKDFEARYDAMNVHDDQFDASEALIATAISMAAVAALAENFWLLASSWICGSIGIFFGVCGFAGLGFHPDILSKFLG
ncbi:MAG TPA: DUF4337 domain-containing protein [Allosphingosinicella sp.]|nr:DUF4337 domain-containing protein [Allosphingosinicella sp.]